MRMALIFLCALAVLLYTGVCFAGLGGPLPAKGSAGAGRALERARASLEQKGYESDEIDSAVAKLGPERLALLEQAGPRPGTGGYILYFWDFLLFVLFVALIVWLIIVLVEAEGGYYYRRRY